MSLCKTLTPAFLGIATSSNCAEAAIDFHDGYFSIDTVTLDLFPGQYVDSCPRMDYSMDIPASPVKRILDQVSEYAKQNHLKFIGCGIDSHCAYAPSLCHFLWYNLDIIPFMFPLAESGDMVERADSAVRKCVMYFGPEFAVRLQFGFRNEVLVDNNTIVLCQLADYKRTVSVETWEVLTMLAEEISKMDLKVCFFNATAQGGGVALMRHALIRLLRLLKISVSWHVPKPNPHVFRITKDNHNLLQGVAKKDVDLTEECKRDWSHWVDLNCERYWVDGPFQWANVIVLDDPQVSPYVEHIKKVNPDCNIIYRSHIEIRSDLVNNPETKQHKLWKYINGFVEKTDLFISHPICSFIPSDIPDEKVLLMPACTDPLDGLNKNMTEEDNIFWLCHFNKISFEQCGNQLAYPDRPFIAQIARFDPSKGIPDVLDAYLLFRKRMAESGLPLEKIPQLCICGQGSVDDPDATSVFNETFNTVNTPEFDEIRSDICICRVPPEDRILNAIVSSAHVMLQLSHREGFEVKVTEALFKKKPVIAYAAGGIPLQLPLDYPLLLPVCDFRGVADKLFDLFTDDIAYTKFQNIAEKWGRREEYFTVFQAVNWLWLIYRLASGWKRPFNVATTRSVYVKDEWKYWYSERTGKKVTQWGDYIPN